MSRKSRFRASGSNDALFAGVCLVAIVVFGIASHADAGALVHVLRSV
ncbi:hypothetical protein [Brevundimonas sp.]|nr:hypothetical protein [Brevundimonas sp.]